MEALKPNGRTWTIREQIVRDPVSGLTLQFDVCADGSMRLRIFGDTLPHGNREIGFGPDGNREWSAVGVGGRAPATGWMGSRR